MEQTHNPSWREIWAAFWPQDAAGQTAFSPGANMVLHAQVAVEGIPPQKCRSGIGMGPVGLVTKVPQP